MSQLAKFTLKTYAKAAQVDPVQRRRDKLLSAIAQQQLVLAAALKDVTYTVPAKTEGKPAKAVRAWLYNVANATPVGVSFKASVVRRVVRRGRVARPSICGTVTHQNGLRGTMTTGVPTLTSFVLPYGR